MTRAEHIIKSTPEPYRSLMFSIAKAHGTTPAKIIEYQYSVLYGKRQSKKENKDE